MPPGTGGSVGAPSHGAEDVPHAHSTCLALPGAGTQKHRRRSGTAPALISGNKQSVVLNQPDPLAHSLVQRLEGQRVLGDRHQQRLPIQHCPGGGAGRPGLPLPEVDRERDAFRALGTGAADLVPVNHIRGAVRSRSP